MAIVDRSADCVRDGYSCISGETLQTAIKELKEDPATRGAMVRELRDRILLTEGEVKVGLSLGTLFNPRSNLSL